MDSNIEMQNTETTEIITSEEKENLLQLMENLLDDYDHNYSRSALEKILDTWIENKANLIKCFKKHPNYVPGKFMIAFNMDLERKTDTKMTNDFFNWVVQTPVITLKNDVPKEVEETRKKEGCYLLPSDAYIALSYDGMLRTLDVLLTSEQAEEINKVFPFTHAHTGQKANRVVNKIMKYLGYDKHPDYNKEYAKYADSMSPMTIKRHTILSLNPIDYLTMSFGNSWASCHTIDKENKRDMPNSYQGAYCSGTISYMLDGTSMVFYTVDASYEGTEFYDEPKITRQMFHWEKPCLIQGRLYPQDNDCDGDLYSQYRAVVQEIIAKIYDIPNLWSLQKGPGKITSYVWSEGTHYRDYEYYNNCTISTSKIVKENDIPTFKMTIGHSPICIYCGKTHNIAENISCCGECRCSGCGELIDEDDVTWIDDEPYCRDCIRYCDHCQEYHRSGEHYISSSEECVCDECYNDYYSICDCCDEIYLNTELSEVEGEMVCRDCYDENVDSCSECGDTYFINHMHSLPNGDLVCDDCYDNLKEETEEE